MENSPETPDTRSAREASVPGLPPSGEERRVDPTADTRSGIRLPTAQPFADRVSGRIYRDAVDMVNDYLVRFGSLVGVDIDPLDQDGYTEVLKGSARVGINVLEEHGVLLLLSKMISVPAEGREALYRRLLELNFLATSDAAFAIDRDKDAVYLRAHRRLGGLDFEEFEDLLRKTATVADEWDDRLAERTR